MIRDILRQVDERTSFTNILNPSTEQEKPVHIQYIYQRNKKSLEKSRDFISARRDSNPRPRPWQGRALPTEPLAHNYVWDISQAFIKRMYARHTKSRKN